MLQQKSKSQQLQKRAEGQIEIAVEEIVVFLNEVLEFFLATP